MTDMLFEFAKTVGAASGIFAAAFLLWDRYIKHFPSAIIVARPLMEGSAQIVPFLLIKNISDRPILVSWDDGDTTRLRIARDQSAQGMVHTLFCGQTVISLGPMREASLPVLRPGTYEQIDPENFLEIDLRWRFAQPRLWKVDRHLRVALRKLDLDAMIEGYIAPTAQGNG